MTNAEMNRRLNTLTDAQYHEIARMIAQGNSDYAIVAQTQYTRKQVNAVFQAEYERMQARIKMGKVTA